MYKHKTLSADTFPSAEQLDDLSIDGWEVFLIFPTGTYEVDADGNDIPPGFMLYLRRLVTH